MLYNRDVQTLVREVKLRHSRNHMTCGLRPQTDHPKENADFCLQSLLIRSMLANKNTFQFKMFVLTKLISKKREL